jgi:Ca2+-transporting ATPase
MRTETLQTSNSSISECCSRLQSNLESGLQTPQILERQLKFGFNEIDFNHKESLVSNFLEKFKDPMISLLLSSAAISIVVGNKSDAFSIVGAVIIVLTVAFVQENKSAESLKALRTLAPPTCRAIRDGKQSEFLARNLVLGDIVVFSRGDRIPADCRIISVLNL